MNPNMWGRGNMQGGQDPASRWLAQQGQMRPAAQQGMGPMQPRPTPHPAMAPQGWMQNQGGAQAAIHPAMQHALDQQAHLQSQLGAMRVQPQPAQMMGASPWGRR